MMPWLLRSSKAHNGILILTQAFSEDALLKAREVAKEAWFRDVGPQVDPLPAASVPLLELTSSYAHWPTGIIGNKEFGYLIPQPEAKEEVPELILTSGASFAVAMGSAYSANIALISHMDSQVAMALLFAIGATPTGFISQDFCKLHRGKLTPAHVDIYEDNEVQRTQAMAIGQGEGATRLCFLRFSHLPEIRAVITELINKDIYTSKGFQEVPKDKVAVLVDCFAKAGCIQYGSPRDLVIWEPGVIHLELTVLPSGLFQPKVVRGATTERYLLGTQNMVRVTPQERAQVALAAHHHFIFHPYHDANKGNFAGVNSVHRKKTRWMRPRERTEDEKKRVRIVQELIDHGATLSGICLRKRHCLGDTQRPEDMYHDEDAKRIHMQAIGEVVIFTNK
jgi:hypothetical protein